MFAQANSEHCRHKIFNADWCRRPEAGAVAVPDDSATTKREPGGVLSAYRDNAAVRSRAVEAVCSRPTNAASIAVTSSRCILLMKVETHNHPTAISPFAGAATGSGGEIRDEGATGRGARPKAGLIGFSVSNLRLPSSLAPWERPAGKPDRIASALDIMIDGPLGGAAFNNEFGRPVLGGYFRTFELEVEDGQRGVVRGYHKPIMVAGGIRQRPRRARAEGGSPGGHGDRGAGRAGDADRPRRRGGVVARVGLVAGGPRLRVRAARQRRDAAPLPGSDRSLRRARRPQPDPLDSRRRRRRPVERASRAGPRQ